MASNTLPSLDIQSGSDIRPDVLWQIILACLESPSTNQSAPNVNVPNYPSSDLPMHNTDIVPNPQFSSSRNQQLVTDVCPGPSNNNLPSHHTTQPFVHGAHNPINAGAHSNAGAFFTSFSHGEGNGRCDNERDVRPMLHQDANPAQEAAIRGHTQQSPYICASCRNKTRPRNRPSKRQALPSEAKSGGTQGLGLRLKSPKNKNPCGKCRKSHTKCTIISTGPRLCANCERRGLQECTF